MQTLSAGNGGIRQSLLSPCQGGSFQPCGSRANFEKWVQKDTFSQRGPSLYLNRQFLLFPFTAFIYNKIPLRAFVR